MYFVNIHYIKNVSKAVDLNELILPCVTLQFDKPFLNNL